MLKNYRNKFLQNSALVTAAAIGAFVSSSAWAQSMSDASAAGEIKTIVVTAEKRPTNAQRTPISIAAVSGAQIARDGESSIAQVMAKVGAVKVLQGQDGPTFYIRGVGTGVPTGIGDPEVNLNIDGIYQSEPEFSLAGLYDIARVEVLRGPQGTLYGKNAVAGAVNIITNNPTFKYEGAASVGVGSYNLIQAQGMINVPLSDTVAVRAAFGTENHSGYLSNGADDANVQSERLKLLYRPNDKVRLVVAADNTHEGGEGEGEIQLTPPPPGFVTNPAYPKGTALLGNAIHTSNPWTSPDPATASRDANFHSIRAQLDWDLGFGVLTVIPAYRHYDYSCLSCWRSETDQNNYVSEHQTTVEARLASEANSPIKWLAGLYYLNSNNPSNGLQLTPGEDSFASTAGNTVNQFGQGLYTTNSYAAFGQATYPVTDWLRLTGGLRYNDDQKQENGFISSQTGGVTTASTGNFTTSKSWDALTYTGGVEMDLAKNSLLYAKVSTGYKAGGFYQGAAPDSYNPEKLTSYEIGSKNRFLNNRLEINVDAFYYDYRDYQVNYLGFINPASAFIFGVLTQNAAGAQIYGADIETRYMLTPNDQLDASVYPLHARFSTLILPGFFGGNFTGNTLPFAPSWSGNLGYQHMFDIGDTGTVTARIETHLETGSWVTFQHSASTYQSSYSNSNAYLTYETLGGKWSVTAYVKNLENAAIITNAQNGPAGLMTGDIAPPRTYGVQVSDKF